MTTQLLKRAVRLFPRTDYLDHSAVRHARRQWLRSVTYLRCAGDGSKWVLDQPVARLK
ncbi:hypothetical protein ACFQAT_07955 [Undibacterium arcticum]|uniref:Uncharacterized protein n=1 Tax=Undibacterium arcticum TaxID=1762892 RepID=A0ABV7F1K1_9BURK